MTVEVQRPVKGLFLYPCKEDDEIRWSDNALDVMPGDPQVITAIGLKGKKILTAYLGNEQGGML